MSLIYYTCVICETSRYNLRNANDVRTINARTKQYFNSFLPSSIRDWNSLPEELRNSESVSSFKFYLNQETIEYLNTVKILKIGTPEIITIIVLQLKQLDFTVQYCVQKMQTE